jgi:hypothetical protein
VLYLNPNQVLTDPYQLAYDIYQFDYNEPWAVNALKSASPNII